MEGNCTKMADYPFLHTLNATSQAKTYQLVYIQGPLENS